MYTVVHFSNIVQKIGFVFVSGNGQAPTWTAETTDSIRSGIDGSLQSTPPFSTVGNRVYGGSADTLKPLGDAYHLDVIGDVNGDYTDVLKAALIDAWSDANPGECASFKALTRM